jgi:zinc transporter ZupT
MAVSSAAMCGVLLLIVQMVSVLSSGDDAFEWAGIFQTPGNSYTWLAQKVNGAYADASMKMAVFSAAQSNIQGLDALESSADTALATSCEDVNSGGNITPQLNKCYRLVFDDAATESRYTISASGMANLAFFCEHFPTEFENTDHFFKDTSNGDVEPDAKIPGYEWAGIFSTPESTYMWTAQKVVSGGVAAYADATMKVAVLPASAANDTALIGLKSAGNTAVQLTNCETKTFGATLTPMANKCYNLQFKQNFWQSLYEIDATNHANVAIFAQHVPTEFENTAHYLKDDHGDDIEPQAKLSVGHAPAPAPVAAVEEKKYWGEGILASIIVNIVTLCGVIFMIPGINTVSKNYREEFECVVMAFAGGAISAAAFFLLLYEATHLIATEQPEEVDQVWRWGTMILTGALFPTVIHGVSEVALLKGQKTQSEPSVKDAEAPADDTSLKISRLRLLSSVVFGDFMHNLCDGFFVGAAFKGCGSSFAWGMVLATVLHEIAQELGDYVVLTGKDCRLHPAIALVFNFLSGTGMLWGTLIVLGTDVNNYDIGMILAFGGGVYLNIAFIECMAIFQRAKVSGLVRLLGVIGFMIGATAIGLILLDHEHCVPPPPPGAPPTPAGGHAHGHR